mmetsp:Transcript_58727/g.86099  ORF Transcript_58727/g.86099 Transcript_58727/m.86099 type:complete len:118 (+) Transcript_58727:89-442(+)
MHICSHWHSHINKERERHTHRHIACINRLPAPLFRKVHDSLLGFQRTHHLLAVDQGYAQYTSNKSAMFVDFKCAKKATFLKYIIHYFFGNSEMHINGSSLFTIPGCKSKDNSKGLPG